MLKWLAAPQLENETETFAAQILHYTLLLLMCMSFSFVFFATSPIQLIFIPVITGIFAGCFYLLHHDRLQLASLIFTSGFWIVITVASFSINGVRNASISSYAIVIIYAAVLFSNWAVIIFTTLSIVSTVILAIGETRELLPLQTTPLYLEDRLFQQIALFSAAGILLYSASRVVRLSFQRVSEHKQMLLEHNDELERQIAERRLTEASLRASEEKYGLLFNNTTILAAVYGSDGEIILVNKAGAVALGGTPETLQGRNLRDVLSPEDAAIAIRDQLQVIEEGKPILREDNVELPTGRTLYYLRHVMPLPKLGEQQASQVLVLTTDLTEKHLAEQRGRELALANEKNAFLTDFFGTVSHDLKTPLTTMNTTLYLLQRAKTAEQREDRITAISEQISLMDQYIQDMLTISRLEHLPIASYETININLVIDEIAALLTPRIEGKRITFEFKKLPDLPPMQGDQEQIRRMLVNLIENAINYTRERGHVTVKAFESNRWMVLEIADSGIGIEPDALPRIFERFYRAPNAKKAERSGTGLGLAIVKKIADMHNATLEVRSQPGKGTTFCVNFPLGPVAQSSLIL